MQTNPKTAAPQDRGAHKRVRAGRGPGPTGRVVEGAGNHSRG
jgi:hypothetical protein